MAGACRKGGSVLSFLLCLQLSSPCACTQPCLADLRCYYTCGPTPELRAGNSFRVVSC